MAKSQWQGIGLRQDLGQELATQMRQIVQVVLLVSLLQWRFVYTEGVFAFYPLPTYLIEAKYPIRL